MTVSSQTSRIEQLGDGTTTAFAVNFYFLENSDLKVFVDGVLQTITTNYTVTGAGNPAGGTVTFVSAPVNGVEVVIFRDPALTQGLDYIDNDPFPAESHERGLDKLTMIAQRVKDLVSRALRLGDSVVGVNTELPALTGSQLLGTKPDGSGFQLYPLGSEPDTAGNIVYTPAGAGAVATTVEDKLRERVSVKDFGAIGDGVADDTAAIQAAIAYGLSARFSGNSGIYGTGTFFVGSIPVIYFPSGVYRVTASLTPDVDRAIAYYEFEGERSIIVADAGVTVFGGVGYNINFKGLTFRDGACAISIKTNNLDTVRISIDNCEFHEQTESFVRTDATSQSSIINITNSKFIQTIANKYIFEFLSGDVINIDNCWITANSNNQAAFYIGPVIASMTNCCLVPWGDFVSPAPDSFALTGRWFDFYGVNLRCRNVRFGGEGGGAPIVYNFTDVKTSTAFPRIYSTIVLDACEIPCNIPTNRVDAGVIVAKSGLPSVIRIVGCRGKTTAPFIYDGMTVGTLASYLLDYESSATAYASISLEVANNISQGYSLTNDATASNILEKYGKRSSTSQTGNRDFFAAIDCKVINGDSFSQTSTAAGTSIVDTGISAATPLVGYGTTAIYDLVVSGNFNSGGSANYRDTVIGVIAIGTGAFAGTQTSISYTQLARSTVTGAGSLTVTAVFWDGATENTAIAVNSTTNQLRIKVSGYTGTVGSAQQVKLVKRT